MNAELKFINGNAIWPINEGKVPIIIAHVANDIGAWGSGFVKAIDKRWPQVQKEYKKLIANDKLSLGIVQFVNVGDITIANMIAQHKIKGRTDDTGRPPIRYGALYQTMRTVGDAAKHDFDEVAEIHCPKFGSGRAGGYWEVIEQMIMELWTDEGINTYVYEFK